MAGAAPNDPLNIMRLILAHKRVGQSPFSQLPEPGTDMLQQQRQSPFAQVFQAQKKPLVPQDQTPAPSQEPPSEPARVSPTQSRSPAPVMASSAPAPIPFEGPMPTTPFQDRMGDVHMAIQSGTFDPTGANASQSGFATYGPDLHGAGATPALRFLDAAAKSAGVKMVPEASARDFEQSLKGVPVNPANWDAMVAGTAPSTNIEDRRGERTWMNKPVQSWNETDKADYASATPDEQNAYLKTLVDSAMGNRENFAPEYQGDPGRSNQEIQR